VELDRKKKKELESPFQPLASPREEKGGEGRRGEERGGEGRRREEKRGEGRRREEKRGEMRNLLQLFNIFDLCAPSFSSFSFSSS